MHGCVVGASRWRGVSEGCESDDKDKLGCFMRFEKVGRCREVVA